VNKYDPEFDNLDDFNDPYEQIAQGFSSSRQSRRKRKSKVNHTPKKSQQDIIHDIVDPVGFEGGIETTYSMTLYEEEFLVDSVRPFYDRDLIVDILAQVKGGKEASVYRCLSHPSAHHDLVAAKVYRPRKFRNLRNDHRYRVGRQSLTIDGKGVNERDWRMLKAIAKGSTIGQQASHTSWLMYEFTTLQKLYKANANVPEPIASAHNAILMGYIGDEHQAAPTLHEVRLQPDERQYIFDTFINSLEIFLQHGFVHGDLSAYNILYWDGDITIIDFPQVVSIHNNPEAFDIFQRDVVRVCEYFARQNLRYDGNALADAIWKKYVDEDPHAGIDWDEFAINHDDDE